MNHEDDQQELTVPESVPLGSDFDLARPRSLGPAERFEPQPPTLTGSLLALLEVPFVHFRLLIVFVTLSVLAAWIAIIAWPRTYESEAKLLIRIGHESIGLDPTATTSQTLVMEKTVEQEVNSALEVLNSRKLAERVVEALGESAILDGVVPPEMRDDDQTVDQSDSQQKSAVGKLVIGSVEFAKDTLSSVLLYSGIRDELSEREQAIREVEGTVTISSPRQSNVVNIHATSQTPHMAQLLAQTVVQQYLQQHLDVSHTSGAQDFFRSQVSQAEIELSELLSERSEFKQQNGIVSITANLGILTEQIAAAEREKASAVSQLQQAEAEMLDLERRLAKTESEIVSVKEEVFDETWSGMRQRVYELEVQEKSLGARYTDDYPPLKQVREQLVGAQKILTKMQSDRVNSSTTLNPVKLKLESDLQELQTRVAGLESMLAKKSAQEQDLRERINLLHQHEQTLSNLDRDARVREDSLIGLRQKLEEARIIDELLDERISSVTIPQPATFVERAASPNKKLLAASVVLIGLLGGLGIALLREMNCPTLRNEHQIASAFGTPVIAKLPLLRQLEQDGKLNLDTPLQLRDTCRHLASN
ncbi:MAG TPA: hypothetical protein DDW52_21625, partial [Planctomycetaceae bacterium]|nr:hypothetical protein [Planctomycetaceae bacterium]